MLIQAIANMGIIMAVTVPDIQIIMKTIAGRENAPNLRLLKKQVPDGLFIPTNGVLILRNTGLPHRLDQESYNLHEVSMTHSNLLPCN